MQQHDDTAGKAWRFAVDRGGTFTDVVATTPDGVLVTEKLLSANPAHYADAASEAVRRLMARHGPVDGDSPIAELRIGTTVATNALLERKGERLALAITRGFGDALRIGTQARPDIFARHIVLPEQLPACVIEIDERIAADGTVLRALDESAARAALAGLRAAGCDALAIVLLHGWQHRAHEAQLAALARAMGFAQVSVSHEVAPLIRLIPRGDTTVVDAYLSPVLRRYTDALAASLPPARALRFMQSNGGLAEIGAFRGKDAILSGPAGGVVGMVAASAPLGHTRLIGFDMGGTSTDVAHYAGACELTGDSVIAGVRVAAPMMQIHTVAAGGGSICRYDGARFRVGPESAGADPGPACYRKGGPLTVTDCNLFLGRIDPGFFPAVFGPGGDQPLDPAAARARLEDIAAMLPEPLALETIAEGFLAIATDKMAAAIRQISVARGHDVTAYALACFGGAGGQHAARVAARGHHADIGGIAPGSMPPDSRSIAEEGILIDNMLLVDEGRLQESAIRAALGAGPFPARNPDRNLSDLRAQLAACARGAELLARAAREHGADVIAAYMRHVLANAEESVRRLLSGLEDGAFAYEMDNGAVVKVAIRIDRAARAAVFDFTGTSAQSPDNFNAPRSITRAAALYVLRTLIDDAIPMNDGCLRPVTLIVPEGSLLNPRPGAAVVAGNVETSQVVTDALFAASGRLAPSQGTMNNFTFGNAAHQYYETICGGSGAGPDHPGTSAVQTHMTNSRLTDPEILEARLPVRVERFAIRRGSGGAGRQRGGDGVERSITFLAAMRANMLAGRRRIAPRGLAGGGDGLPGANWVERADGTREELGATGAADMQPGDRFVILSPGGGGFGAEGAKGA